MKGKIYDMDHDVVIETYCGQKHNVSLQVSSYGANGLPAISAILENGTVWGTLTINLGKTFEKFGNFVTTVEDEFYEQLLQQNIVFEEIIEIPYGFSRKAHLCQINMNQFNEITFN